MTGLAVSLLLSCSRKMEVTNFDFVDFYSSSASVLEDVGTVNVPIFANAVGSSNFKVSVSVLSDETTAVSEEDYVIENDVISFEGGSKEEVKNLSVSVLPHIGTFTGPKKLVLKLASTSDDGVVLGKTQLFVLNIGDKDHPLTAMFGDYTLHGVSLDGDGYYPFAIKVNISAYEGNTQRVWIKNISPFFVYYANYIVGSTDVYGEVSADMSTITIPTPQVLEASAKDAFGLDEPYTLYKWEGNADGAFVAENASIVFTLNEENGTYVTKDSYGLSTSSQVENGLFYYDMNVFSTFHPSYPTYLEKNE